MWYMTENVNEKTIWIIVEKLRIKETKWEVKRVENSTSGGWSDV